ncbi:CD81 antigen-like [Argonauta hians]
MVAGCSNNCMKYILLFFNLLIFILGIAGVALGTVLVVNKDLIIKGLEKINEEDIVTSLSTDSIKTGGTLLIIASVITVLIAFFGCYGAWKENGCMLGTYAAVMSLILILQVAVFILAAVAKPKVEAALKEGLEKLVQKYGSNGTIDDFFKSNNCCGIQTGDDTSKYKCGKLKNQEGCYTKFKNTIDNNLPAVIGIAVGIVLVQLVLIIFACCLRSARNDVIA